VLALVRGQHYPCVMTVAAPPPALSAWFTEQDFRAVALRALRPQPSDDIFDPRTGTAWAPSDFDLNPDMLADFAVMEPARPAAVLIPLIAREELTVLLTERSAKLKAHAGQISFPGGRIDPEDASPTAAALREAEEEIGLDRRYVEPLGFIDSYRTGTGYRVMPLVAFVQPGFSLQLNPGEVESAFEVPLRFLMDPANHQKHTREWRGRERSFYAMPYGERYIWGATAGMLKNLHSRLVAT
jgi:8-oxo-dGTP pyrophosphatase MutT (NUDIX family)